MDTVALGYTHLQWLLSFTFFLSVAAAWRCEKKVAEKDWPKAAVMALTCFMGTELMCTLIIVQLLRTP